MASRIEMVAGLAAMALAVAGLAGPPKSGKSDLVMFGGTPARNMVNTVARDVAEKPNPLDGRALLWKAELGSLSLLGTPTIAGGRVFVGTNNNKPRNPRDTKSTAEGEVEPIDKGVLMCFDEATGKFLWQAVHDKLPGGQVRDWPDIGVSSTPVVEGDRVYYVSNRCTLVCLDVEGFANGKQGKPLQYPDTVTKKPNVYDTATDADAIWELDMIKDLGVFPHNSSVSSPMIVGDLVYVVTSNGVDENHKKIPKPDAPSFIAVNKKTGALVWKSNLPGKNIMHGQWSNPCYSDTGGVKQAIFPGGDGWLYSFTAEKGELVWKFDANPKGAVYDLGGSGTKSDFIGTPVVSGGKLYIGTGQDPDHFTGVAHFYCIDLAKAVKNAKKNEDRDVSPELIGAIIEDDDGNPMVIGHPNPDSALGWHYGGADDRPFSPRSFAFGRTMSTACVIDGIVYISEISGYLHCLDAKTGKKFWQYDLKGEIWGSPFYADGKIYLGATDELFVFKHDKAPKAIDEIDNPDAKDQESYIEQLKAKRKSVEKEYLISKVQYDALIRSTPVVANGTLYVTTEKTLYAFKPTK
jgi:outer membrane protein assembly factor BamB